MLTRFFLIFITITLLCSCKPLIEDMPGVYVSNNQLNNLDTIIIFENGKYENRIYKKLDNSLIYINMGNWKYEDGRIIFQDFFEDNDRNFSPDFKGFKDALITSSFPVMQKNGNIYFSLLEDKNEYKFKKVSLTSSH